MAGNPFDPVLEPLQRRAIQQAYGDRNVRPVRLIVELAEAGELTADGDLVPAFAVKESTARDIGSRYARKRQGLRTSPLSELPPADGIEQMRKRLVSVAEVQLDDVARRAASKRNPSTAKEAADVARLVREIERIGEQGRAGAPAARKGGDTPRTGLAAQALGAARPRRGFDQAEQRATDAQSDAQATQGHDAEDRALHGADEQSETHSAEHTARDAVHGDGTAHGDGVRDDDGDDLDPGQYARRQASELTADGLSYAR